MEFEKKKTLLNKLKKQSSRSKYSKSSNLEAQSLQERKNQKVNVLEELTKIERIKQSKYRTSNQNNNDKIFRSIKLPNNFNINLKKSTVININENEEKLKLNYKTSLYEKLILCCESKISKEVRKKKLITANFIQRKHSINVELETKHQSLMIYPDSIFRKIWDPLIFFSLLYTAIFLPYSICFLDTSTSNVNGLLETIIDFLFLLDVVVNFFSAYLDEIEIIIDDREKIFIHYFYGYFFIDLLGGLPIQLILSSVEESHDRLNDVGGIARVYKLFRLIRLIKMIRVKKYDKIINYIFSQLDLNVSLGKILFIVLITFLLVHISSCLFYFLTKVEDFNASWLYLNDLYDYPDLELYLTCVYWSMYTIFTIGFGDIKPASNIEKIFAIIWIIYGALFYSYTFGNLKTIISNYDKRDLIINEKIKKIEDFSEKLNISRELTYKIKSFYSHKFQNNLIYDNDKLLNELSDELINKIIRRVYKELLNDNSIFRNSPNKFINEFILCLKPLFLKLPNMVLYEIGKFTEEVYFVSHGKIGFYTENQEKLLVYSKGTYFGEVEVFFDEPRYFNAISQEPVELLFMNKFDFLRILMKFPKMFEMEIYKAYKRREFYLKRMFDLRKKQCEIKGIQLKNMRRNFTARHNNTPISKEQIGIHFKRNLTKLDNYTLLQTAFNHMDSENSKLTIKLGELKELKMNFSKCVKQLNEKLSSVNKSIISNMRINNFSFNNPIFEKKILKEKVKKRRKITDRTILTDKDKENNTEIKNSVKTGNDNLDEKRSKSKAVSKNKVYHIKINNEALGN